MSGSASILHADLDSFFASVEQRDDPALRDRPVAVGGGVVLAASYQARAYGVRTAMSGRLARALCPGLVVVPPRMAAYSAASRDVFRVFDETSPVVEALSIDEAFLDVSGLRRAAGDPVSIGVRLRRRVREEVGLPITVGVAASKFLAKVASRQAKPDGLLLVPAGAERQFLHPLPVEALWGVGKVTTARLAEFGIRTVAQLAAAGEPTVVSLLGPAAGHHLCALADGRDPRRVRPGRRRSSVGAQRALGRGRHQPADVDAALIGLVERVTRRLRDAGRQGRTVTVRMRFDDWTRATRSRSLRSPTALTAPVLREARRLLAEAAPLVADRGGLTLIGVGVSGLDTDGAATGQPELPFDAVPPQALDGALDAVRERFGRAALTRAVLLGRDPGLAMPLLPD
nr:DNA polymerase IV [Nakamurella endophytica]